MTSFGTSDPIAITGIDELLDRMEKDEFDLIAIGRQSQYNPNIAHHWAHDLGLNRKFEDWTPEYGWWLEKRIRTIEGFATPTGVVKRQV